MRQVASPYDPRHSLSNGFVLTCRMTLPGATGQGHGGLGGRYSTARQTPLSAYARTMRYPVLTHSMVLPARLRGITVQSLQRYIVLRGRYALSGTDICCATTRWRGVLMYRALQQWGDHVQVSAYARAMLCPLLSWRTVLSTCLRPSYAMPGTDVPYGATRC
eukprot:3358421-Rhodomonas_salina.7